MGKLKKKTGLFYLVNAALTVALFAVLVVLIMGRTLNGYVTGILVDVCINIILAVSLNLVTGILGQLVLGHAGFMLVGAYAAANFTKAVVNNGVKVFGVTIHYVDATLDGGKIISQRAFGYDGDDIAELEARIHAVEYPLYIETINKLLKE